MRGYGICGGLDSLMAIDARTVAEVGLERKFEANPFDRRQLPVALHQQTLASFCDVTFAVLTTRTNAEARSRPSKWPIPTAAGEDATDSSRNTRCARRTPVVE